MSFFQSIGAYLELFVNFLVNFVKSIIDAVAVVVAASSIPTQLYYFLPGILGASVMAVVFVGAIKFLAGR